MHNAVIYARFSAGPHQTDRSIEGQVSDCMRYAESHGLNVIDTYADHHVSGKSTEGRDAFLRLIADAKKGTFTDVIVWKVDRFGRNKMDLVIYKNELKRAGVKLHYAAESIPDGPEGIILESLMEGLAEYYSAELSQKIRRGIRTNAENGKWSPGVLPFGYMKDEEGRPVPDPEKAPIIREAFTRYASGEPGSLIVQDLTKRGIKVNKSTLYRWLRNERYLGHWCILDVLVEVEPLITEEQFMAVQKSFKKSRNQADRVNPYILTGKCVCGVCGRPMQGASGRGKAGSVYHYYRCSGRKDGSCKLRQFSASYLEAAVINATTDIMLTNDMIERIVARIMEIQKEDMESSELPRLEKALEDVHRRRKNILNAIESGISAPELSERLNELIREANDLSAAIAKEKTKKPLIPEDTLREWLRSFKAGSVMDDAFCDRLIRTFVHSVTVFEDHAVLAFNAQEADGSLCSTKLRELDFASLSTNTPEVFMPFVLLLIRLD